MLALDLRTQYQCFFSYEARELKTKLQEAKRLSKARDNNESNDQLCKDVDLKDSHIRDKQTSCNLTADK